MAKEEHRGGLWGGLPLRPHCGEGRGIVTYLVEHYLAGATPEGFRATAGRLRSVAARMTSGGTPIRYRQAILVPSDEAAFCVFDAASVTVIEQLYSRAGIAFDRIVDALEV